MTLITKRNGEKEEFDRRKLELSMCMAGAGGDDAREIAGKIPVSEGLSTDEIRGFVIEELRIRNPVIASHYERTLRFVTSVALDAERGMARISEEALHRLKIRPGETFHLVNGEKSILITAQKGSVHEGGIELHKEDLKAIEVKVGKKIATKRHDGDG